VRPDWAAWKLISAHHEREMRRTVRDSLELLNAGDVDAAQEKLLRLSKPMEGTRLSGLNVMDPSTVEDQQLKVAYPVPWGPLQRNSGGIGLGELWYLAARLGQGKSWILAAFIACLAEYGATVAVMSCEMPKRSYVRRMQTVLSRHDRELQKQG
jgi:replicative DNA helicase